MLALKDAAQGSKAVIEIENVCQNLFNEWLFNLNSEEKEIWLWNGLVKMVKIKQGRHHKEARG